MEINLAARIKELRCSKGLSANKLATISGISQSYIRKLEAGECKPTIEILSLICDAIGIDISDLLSNDEKEYANYQKLRVLKLLNNLSNTQIDGLIKLLEPYNTEIE